MDSTWGFEPRSPGSRSPVHCPTLPLSCLACLSNPMREGENIFHILFAHWGAFWKASNIAQLTKSSLFTHAAWSRTFSHVIRYLIMLKMQLYDFLSELSPSEEWEGLAHVMHLERRDCGGHVSVTLSFTETEWSALESHVWAHARTCTHTYMPAHTQCVGFPSVSLGLYVGLLHPRDLINDIH